MKNWNEPDAKSALVLWRHIDELTLFQTVMLIFGRDPSHTITGRPAGFIPTMKALVQAIKRNEIPASWQPESRFGKIGDNAIPISMRVALLNRPPDDNEIEEFALVRQADIRKWLPKVERTDAFFFLADPGDWPVAGAPVAIAASKEEDKPLDPRERSTLLAIIGALAKEANLDLAQPYKTGDAIAAMLPGDVKPSGRTIGDHLKAAAEAMSSRKAKSPPH